MKDALSVVAQSRTRLAVLLALLAVLIAGGVTLGSWTVAGSGSGYAKATSSQNLVLGDASASTTGDLYPGGQGVVEVKVTNNNPFAVTITSVSAGAGAVTSNSAGCNAASVTFNNQTGLSLSLGAGATQTFPLANGASMSSAAVDACQNAVFTIPVTVAATS